MKKRFYLYGPVIFVSGLLLFFPSRSICQPPCPAQPAQGQPSPDRESPTTGVPGKSQKGKFFLSNQLNYRSTFYKIYLLPKKIAYNMLRKTYCWLKPIFRLVSKCQPATDRRANYRLADRFTASKLQDLIFDTRVQPHWIGGSELFWYSYRGSSGIGYYIVDPGRKSRSVFSDRKKLDAALAGLEGKKEPSPTIDQKAWETYSPDEQLVVYARGHNLFLRQSGDPGGERQITFDGERFYSYSQPEDETHINEEKHGDNELRKAKVLWSDDSKKFFISREDLRHVNDFWVINSLSEPRPTLITYKTALPGEEIRKYEAWIYNHNLKKMIRVSAERWTDQSYESFSWSRDSKRLFICRKSRDHCKGDLLSIDAETGRARVLIEERLKGLVLTKPVTEVEDTGEFLWWSRRSGYGHYYLYDSGGGLKNPVTSGPFNVEQIVGIDGQNRLLYFLANGREAGRNPYYNHLYKVKLDGSDLRLLTPEDAEHEIHMSGSLRYFVDNFSRMDSVPRSVLRDRDGRLILELETADLSLLTAAGWKMPEIFTAKAADGRTDIWGVMWKPFDLDPCKKYPIITYVYPGPQDETVPISFFGELNHVHLAQYGFIVVMFGNRGGSQRRSLAYAEFGRGNLRDYGLADKKAVIEQLAARYTFIDIDRVGIWGGSSGGYMAASAMLLYPDFFKVGVARSGQHDPSIYDRWWSEMFQGVKEVKGADGKTKWTAKRTPTNLEIANRLKGHLLIIHSEMDTNVHPAHSARLVDTLMTANKRFDYLVVPGGGHGWSKHWRYVQRLIWTYFVKHLLGDQRESIDMFRH